jgi:inorganic pyrophosphatase/exopolyphosphatase
MHNITSFKKDIKNYKAMELIACSIKDHKFLDIKREIALVDTVQFALKSEYTDKQGQKYWRNSFMRYPKANGYSYNAELDQFTFMETFNTSQGTIQDFFTYQLYK